MSANSDTLKEIIIDQRRSPQWRELLPLLTGLVIFFDTLHWSLQNSSLFIIGAWSFLLGFHIYSYSTDFHTHSRPLVLLGITCLLHLVNRHSLDIHVISLCLVILFYFAIAGCYLTPKYWQKLQMPALFALLLTPLFDYLQIYFGFPLRLLSAHVAGNLLTSLNHPVYSDSDLLHLENQYMQVDIDCSGFSGLWAGLVFFVFVSWIYQRRVNLQWCLSVFVFAATIITFNAIRISSIVWIDLIQKQAQLAASLHQSIGIVCFILACLFGWSLMLLPQFQWRRNLKRYIGDRVPTTVSKDMHTKRLTQPQQRQTITVPTTTESIAGLNVNTVTALLLFIGFLCALPQASVIPSDKKPAGPKLQLPDAWSPSSSALNRQEKLFFGAKKVSLHKQDFQFDDMPASMILVSSHYWKTQHNPKHCLQAQGYSVSGEKTVRIANGTRIRQLILTREQQRFTSLFWWKNANQQTEDYGQRVFSGIIHPAESWTMISILVKGSLSDRQIADLASIIIPQLDDFYRYQHENQS